MQAFPFPFFTWIQRPWHPYLPFKHFQGNFWDFHSADRLGKRALGSCEHDARLTRERILFYPVVDILQTLARYEFFLCSHHSIQILVYIPSAQNNRADAPSRLLITRLGTLAPTATSNEGAGDFPDSLPIIIYYFNHDLVDFNFTQMAQSLFMLKIPASHKAHSSDNHQHKSITFYMLNPLPIWRSECEGCNECCAATTTSENLFRLCLVRSSISLPLLPS